MIILERSQGVQVRGRRRTCALTMRAGILGAVERPGWQPVVQRSALSGSLVPRGDPVEAEVRAYVSHLWSEDWDSPEDSAYDDLQ